MISGYLRWIPEGAFQPAGGPQLQRIVDRESEAAGGIYRFAAAASTIVRIACDTCCPVSSRAGSTAVNSGAGSK